MKLEDHIAIFENVLPPDACDYCINYFEVTKKINRTLTRRQLNDGTALEKDDETLFVHNGWELFLKNDSPHAQDAMKVLGEKYEEYISVYASLKEAKSHSVYGLRVQKTLIGGGYHRWHFENDSRNNSNRLVVFMYYLNDVQEGGETEFLYQHKRYKATKGTLVIWPASYTHTHRGNPPLSNDKYIITGWMEY